MMKKKIQILYLEDEKNDVELVKSALESSEIECKIIPTDNGEEFEDLLKKSDIDLILADYKLPGFDGTRALKKAQKIRPETPFIFVSGTVGEDAAINGFTQGATDYVPKTKLNRLIRAIERALNEAENFRERKRAEDALIGAGERFRAVADNAIEGIVIANRQGSIIYWNNAAEQIFGYSVKEITGKPISTLMPKEVQNVFSQKITQRHKTNKEERVSKIIESLGKKKNGEEFPIDLSITSWKTAEGMFFTAIIRDITLRKKIDASLNLQSAALEAAANGIVITDRDGNITWVNSAFTKLTGYTAEDVIGKNPRVLKSGEQSKAYYKDLWDTITSGQVWHNELVNRRTDGSFYTEEMTIAPVFQEKGEIESFIAIKQDVSERKQHELEREAVISVASAMRDITSREDLIMTFLNEIVRVFNADGSMFVNRNTGGESFIEMGCGPVGENFTGLQIPKGKGISNKVITEGKLYINEDAPNDPVFFRPDLLGDSCAAACIPLIAQEEVIGALWMARKKKITQNDVNLIGAIADLAANAIHRVTLYEQTKRQLRQMDSLHQIDMAINSILDLNIILNILLRNVSTQLGVDAASVMLLKPHTQTLQYTAGIGFRTYQIDKSSVKLGEGRAGTAAADRKIVLFPDLDQSKDTFGRETLLKGEGFKSHHVAPLIVKGQIKGVLEVFRRERFDPTEEWIEYFKTFATQAALAVDNTTLFNELQHSNADLIIAYDATIEGWSLAMDMRDKETEGHTQRVVEMAVHFGELLGMNNDELINIRRGALLHDIGKIGVPDHILLKPDKLTDVEWVLMKKHPKLAYDMLSEITYLKKALDIPYCHHEKWDGSGYPRGLKAEHIPIAARIFSIVDVWDALTSDRPYRKAWTRKKALEYIRDEAGKSFDPKLVEIFIKEMEEARERTK